jgi:hypothetical protein
MDILAGWKSIIAAGGFLIAAYVAWSQGDLAGAWAHLMAALAVFGIRAAIARK